MLAFTFLILKDVLKYAFISAGVMVYIEAAPGGEHLGTLVGMFEDMLLSIDWAGVTGTISEAFRGFLTDPDVQDQLTAVEVAQP